MAPLSTTMVISLSIICRLADRSQNYLRYLTLQGGIQIIGFFLLAFSLTTGSFGFKYFCLFVVYAGGGSSTPLLGAWMTLGLNGSAQAATGIALWNCVGNLGGVSGPQIFAEAYALTDGYSAGAVIFLCLVLLGVLIAFAIEYRYPSIELRQRAETKIDEEEATKLKNGETSNEDSETI